ncbi:MAG TPA: YwqG family protein [Vicinamibacteria bacterium]|nr:YwqG family protein [Vicinamibacteria bacterium]
MALTNLDGVIATARRVGYSDIDSLRRLARSAVVLTPGQVGNEASPFTSRLGGLPAMSASVAWPRRGGKSLAFIAQIDLGSQPDSAFQLGLPRDGLLLFFYDSEQSTWGFDPNDAGSFAVIHLPKEHETRLLDEWPKDLPEHARYPPCDLASGETITLPAWESVLIEDLHLDSEQLQAYQDLLEATGEDDDAGTPRGLLGGHPDQIQGDMMLECALVAAGLYCGDATAYEDPRLPEIRKTAPDWRLLMQVPSVEEAGMMWGDLGCLYYWIHEEDLRARRFDRSWMILQCS